MMKTRFELLSGPRLLWARGISIAALLGAALAAQFTVPDPLCLRLAERVTSISGRPDGDFGARVALSGDTLVIGAPDVDLPGPWLNSGAAYVFRRDAGGVWTEEAEFLDAALGPVRLGSAVALDSDLAVVGGQHVAQVFERTGGAWSAPIPLVGSSSTAQDQFGTAVAIEGERILVGAPGDIDNGSLSGAVYVFERIGGSWVEVVKLHSDDAELNQKFGASVALSQDRALIGAWGADGSSLGSGAAYVFTLDPTEGWHQQQKLVSGSTAAVPFFGWSVDLAGDRAIVGNGRPAGEAAAYVFGFDGASWQREARFSEAASDFGVSVAIDGDVALVGAITDSTFGFENGATFVYVRRDGSWALEVAMLSEELGGRAGSGLAIEEGTAVVGLPGARSGAERTGAAEIYTLGLHVAPAVATRNAGTNPFSYVATPVAIGETLQLTVFTASTGHTHALVFGFDSAVEIPLASGQTLLCLDLGGNGEMINTGFQSAPIASFELEVPANLALSGLVIYTQAVQAFGAVPFALSNAQDIVIGGCQ